MIVGYIRVSTQKQVEEGVSLGMQQEQIIKHLLLLELIQTKNDVVFFVDEGASASSLNRPAMSKMIELVKQGAVELIVTYDLSRVSRDIFDSTVFLKLMSKHNVVFKCLHDDVNIATAGNRFSTNVKIAVNQFEREKIIERTNDGLLSIVESGRYPCGGRLPFGYDRDENKQIVVNEKEAEIIRIIFDCASSGYTLSFTAEKANEKQTIKKFTAEMIYYLLRNKKYIGYFKYKGKEYAGIVPAIISEECQKKAISLAKKKKKKDNIKYIFDELIYCSCCDKRAICVHSVGYGNKKYYYYKCTDCNTTVSQTFILKKISNINISKERVAAEINLANKNKSKLIKRFENIKLKYLQEKYTEEEYLTLVIPLNLKIEESNKIINNILKEHQKLKKENPRSFYQLLLSAIYIDMNKKSVVRIVKREL